MQDVNKVGYLKMGSVKKHNNKNLILFLILFFTNIGFKEVFDFLSDGESVPIGVLIFSLISIVVFMMQKGRDLIFVSICFLFYLYLILSSLSSTNPEYGLEKAYLGLLLPLTLYCFFNKREWTLDEVLKYLIIAVLLIDIIGIVVKLRTGFWSRGSSFGLLGAIPFGWVNGMAFLAIALKEEKKMKDIVGALFFLAMVLWTGSKGPLVGIFIMSLLFFNKVFGKKVSSKIIVSFLTVVLVLILSELSDSIRSITMIINFLEDPEAYSEGVGQGSFGTRMDFYKEAISLFVENPLLGIGFGGSQEASYLQYKYPHNIFFELLSETGLVGIFLISLIFSKLKYNNTMVWIGIFGVISLMFSGDFSYFRYAFFPLLISLHIKTKK